MNDKLEIAQYKFIGYLSKLSDSFGLNKLVAQIYALLYLSDKALSLDEIAEKLKVSKGSISVNIRELEKWGAVKSVWVKGSRKDYYEAELNLKKIISNKLRSAVEKRLVEVGGVIDECNSIVKSSYKELSEEDKNIVKIYEERLQKIEDLKTLASSMLIVAGKLL